MTLLANLWTLCRRHMLSLVVFALRGYSCSIVVRHCSSLSPAEVRSGSDPIEHYDPLRTPTLVRFCYYQIHSKSPSTRKNNKLVTMLYIFRSPYQRSNFSCNEKTPSAGTERIDRMEKFHSDMCNSIVFSSNTTSCNHSS